MNITSSVKKGLLRGAALFAIVSGGFGLLNAQPHNGTEQLPNRGFELYDNVDNDNIEPQGWNSFMTANASGMASLGKSRRLSREKGGRPSGKGAYYLRIYSDSPLANVVANGNVTTGRINMGSTTATDASNHNFTDRGNEGFYWRQTTVPDSLVIWLWFKPKGSASDQAQVNVIIHNDNNTKDPGTAPSQVVAQAKINPTATDGWQRFSVPFVKTGATNDAQYVLASFTTNQTPGKGAANDELYVDDIFFVYNPTLRLQTLNTTAIGLRDGENVSIEVPFRITGTMSPQMGDDNIVIAELSDAAGSFAHATEIGRITTDESGSIMASLPPTLPTGNGYRIRVRSTNYPRVSDDNGKDIELFRGYYIEGVPSSPTRGNVSGSQTYKQGAQATLTAVATPGNHFSHWSENGSRIEGAGATYAFTVERNRTLTAHFDTNYYNFKLQTEGQGEVSVSPQAEAGRFIHNATVRLQASPSTGSTFVGFYDEQTLLNNQPDYTFNIVRDLNLTARFDLQQFNLTAVTNNTALGRVEGSGTYKYKSTATLKATPNPYCRFVAWIGANGDTLSKENPFAYTVTAAARITGVFAETFYRVAKAAQPVTGGSVIGGGSFSAQQPQTITLTAAARDGYTFAYWQIERADGETDAADQSQDNPLTLVSGRITTDYNCTAVFEPIRYRITATAEPEEGGSVTGEGLTEGSGLFEYQNSVSLTAQPAAGYTFTAWQEAVSGKTLSSQATYTFPATADLQLLARFERERYAITVKADPNNYGHVTGGNDYAYGDEAILNAVADNDYEFRYWYRGDNPQDTAGHTATLTVPVERAQTYTAVFSIKRKQASATAVPSQGGRITGTGLYEHGATARLWAEAATGYRFSGWRDAAGNPLETGDEIRLSMAQDQTVQAIFTPIPYKITLAVAGNLSDRGEISFDGITYGTTLYATLPYDSTLTLYAQAKSAYKVTDWNQDGSEASLGRTEQIRYTVKGDARIAAAFETDLATIAVAVEPEAAGTIVNVGNHPKKQYITLTAEAADGYHLARWTDATGTEILGTDPTYTTDPLTADLNLKAVFEKNTYTLTIAESEPAGAGTATLSAGGTNGARELTLAHGATFILKAQAADGYAFAGWQTIGSDEIFSTEAVYEGVATQEAGFRALFKPLPYTLTTHVAHTYQGRTRGDGRYNYGSPVTVTAIPTPGHHFKAWQLSVVGSAETTDATGNPYTFNLSGETTAEAIFDTNTYTVSLESRQPEWGSATMTVNGAAQGTTSLIHNGQATFTASVIDEAHYRFAHFADRSGRKIGTTNPWTLTVTSDTTVYAVFEPVTFKFSAESAEPAMGAVSYNGGMAQPYLGKVKITAEPLYGHQFVKWVLADQNGEPTETLFSEARETELTIVQDTALRAVFAPERFFVSCEAALDGSGFVEGPDSLCTFGNDVQVAAEPAYGYKFSHWEINGTPMSNEPVYTWNVSEKTKAVAVFTPVKFRIDLALSPANLGYTTGYGLYNYGDTAVIEAVPNNGYYFRGWHNGHYVVSRENPYRTVVGRDSSFTAILETDTLTVSLQVLGQGEARGAGRFLLRENVSLEAIPAPGYNFLAWRNEAGERVSTENPFEFPATADVAYTAVFLPKTYAVTLNTEAGGTLSGGGDYTYLSDIVLLAKADSVHTFRCWQLDEVSAEDSLLSALFTPEVLQQPRLTYRVDRPLGLTAVFDPFTYTIQAEASPANSGTFRGTGTFNHGASTVLEALPAEHFDFAVWTLDGETVSFEPTLEIPSIEENRLYTALFKPTEYQIELKIYPPQGGVVTGAGAYRFGDTVLISVNMQPGYMFQKWVDKDFQNISDQPSFLHIVSGSNIFTASVKAANESDRLAGSRLKVYPNPAVYELHFESDSDLRRIAIFDASGRLLRQMEVSGREATLYTADCPSGLHFYRVEWQDGRVSHGKWVR